MVITGAKAVIGTTIIAFPSLRAYTSVSAPMELRFVLFCRDWTVKTPIDAFCKICHR